MADVRELLLPCDVQHVIDHGWKILLTHLVKGELPELLSSWIENCVLSAVSVSSEVAHPHVIASVREDETCQSECALLLISISTAHHKHHSTNQVPCLLPQGPSPQRSKAAHAEGRPQDQHLLQA